MYRGLFCRNFQRSRNVLGATHYTRILRRNSEKSTSDWCCSKAVETILLMALSFNIFPRNFAWSLHFGGQLREGGAHAIYYIYAICIRYLINYHCVQFSNRLSDYPTDVLILFILISCEVFKCIAHLLN